MLNARYGMGLGLDLLREARLRAALPLLIKPINYWRTAEYQAVWDQADFRPSDQILDVGSPKLLAVYLAERLGAQVCATDIHPYFIATLTALRRLRRIPDARLRLQVEDARALSFPDASFNKAYSISVLEHIPDDGDSLATRQLGRVLTPGGRCVLTVPFAPAPRDEYRDGGFYWSAWSSRGTQGVFYQRRYDEESLHRRLIAPSGLALVRLGYIGERGPHWGTHELADYLPALSGPVQPLLSELFHTPLADSWRDVQRPLCAVVVLEKP